MRSRPSSELCVRAISPMRLEDVTSGFGDFALQHLETVGELVGDALERAQEQVGAALHGLLRELGGELFENAVFERVLRHQQGGCKHESERAGFVGSQAKVRDVQYQAAVGTLDPARELDLAQALPRGHRESELGLDLLSFCVGASVKVDPARATTKISRVQHQLLSPRVDQRRHIRLSCNEKLGRSELGATSPARSSTARSSSSAGDAGELLKPRSMAARAASRLPWRRSAMAHARCAVRTSCFLENQSARSAICGS